jgi:APA family basic amino acid/polyamine antiporter
MSQSQSSGLKRSLGLFALVAYGVGDTLGAGIYALVGKIAGMVGPACWMSFFVALCAAGFTALTYAEMSARYPYASGEAHFTFEAFHFRLLSHAVGFLVFMSGITSICAVAHAFAGYLQPFLPDFPKTAIIIPFFLVIGAVTLSGIENSSLTNLVCTAVEVSGLLIVIYAGFSHFGTAQVDYMAFLPELQGAARVQAVLGGAVFAFYAFVGFEDMVKASEEVKDPQKNMPRGILLTLCITGLMYMLVSLSAVTVLSPEALRNSTAPLMDVVKAGAPRFPVQLFTGIALFAVANTALVNFMMSSRILYGMAHDNLMPRVFGRVHPRFRTPHIATAAVFTIVLILTLTGNLSRLAQSTAVLVLSAFFTVNLSLLRLKFLKSPAPPNFKAPFWAPVLGAFTCFGLLFYASGPALLTAVILLAISFTLFGLNRVFKL